MKMEGQSNINNKLKFKELKKIKTPQIGPVHKAIAAANSHNLIFICSDGNTVKAISSQILDDGFSDSGRNLQLSFRPTLLTVARYGYSSTLLVTGQNDTQNCPVVEAFDIDNLQSIGRLNLTELGNAEIVDYAWNPNYYESIVTLCTNRGHLVVVAIDRKIKGLSMVYNEPQYGALTCCWSPKGKNLAIGMQNGKILRLEPVITTSGFTFKEVANSVITLASPKITPEHQVVKLRWLNKTFLLSVHAKYRNPNGPDTIYSVITVKPSKPFLYWPNVCFENQIQTNYTIHLANLTNAVVCSSNASSEATVIGVNGSKEAKSNELKDWHSVIIDEEGARIELPLDANNRETYPLGFTTAYLTKFEHPILLFYSSDGHICPYAAIHSEGILKLPEFQQPLDCPIRVQAQQQPLNIPVCVPNQQQMLDSVLRAPTLQPLDSTLRAPTLQPIDSTISIPTQQPLNATVRLPTQQSQSSAIQIQPQQPLVNSVRVQTTQHIQIPTPTLSKDIKSIRDGIEFNQQYLTLFEEVNQLRDKFDEVLDMHTSYKEVRQLITQDISSLDLGMLENLYLVSHIRSVLKNKHSPRPIDPVLRDKYEKLKSKTRAISEQISSLNDQVDSSWENSRRNNNKKHRISSLETIYQTLATNHKIISLLKMKASNLKKNVPEESPAVEMKCEIRIREPYSKQLSFRELLASRNTVPVRRAVTNK